MQNSSFTVHKGKLFNSNIYSQIQTGQNKLGQNKPRQNKPVFEIYLINCLVQLHKF